MAGELLVLRPAERAALPLSYAVMLVLLRAGSPAEFLVTVVAAEAVAYLLRPERSEWDRIWLTATRLAAAVAALGAFHAVVNVMHGTDSRWMVLTALFAAGVAEILVDDLLQVVRARHFYLSTRGRSADLALITSGMLMSIGYRGIGGLEGMGLWGPLLFSIPLLAAWYSFERLASIRRTYEQTISALSVVPELAGLVREGHATRVADLSVALGRELHLPVQDLEYLRAAALLHHLGHLCLDDPERPGPRDRAERGDGQGRRDPARDRVPAAGRRPPGVRHGLGRQPDPAVASAFDELTAGDPTFNDAAIEALYSGPGYVYDPRVLDVLERVAGVGAKVPSGSSSSIVASGSRVEVVRGTRGTSARTARPAARPVGEVDEPDRDHEVAEGDRRVDGRAERDVVAELRQHVVGLLRSVLHGRLGLRALGDLVGHALVQRDHEGVHRDADGDHAHARQQQVGEPEAEDQDVRGEQEREADVVEARGAG